MDATGRQVPLKSNAADHNPLESNSSANFPPTLQFIYLAHILQTLTRSLPVSL